MHPLSLKGFHPLIKKIHPPLRFLWKRVLPAGKTTRRCLFMASGMLVLALLGAGLLVSRIDSEQFRQPVVHTLSRAAGTPVHLDSIGWQWNGGLRLTLRGLSLQTQDGNRFSAEELTLWPVWSALMKNQLRVKKAIVLHPRWTLNASDALLEKRPLTVAVPEENAFTAVNAVAGNATSSAPPARKNSPKAAAPDIPSQNIIRDGDWLLENVQFQGGQILIVLDEKSGKPVRPIAIPVSFDLKFQRGKGGRVNAVLKSLQLKHENIVFRGTAYAQDLTSRKPRLDMRLKSDPFTLADVKSLESRIPEFKLPRELTAAEVQWMSLKLNAPLVKGKSLEWWKQNAEAKTAFRIKNAQAHIEDNDILLPQAQGIAQWKNNLLDHDVEGVLFGGKIREQGTLRLADSSADANDSRLDAKITLTGLNLAAVPFLNRPNRSIAKGGVSGSLQLKGPFPIFQKADVWEKLEAVGRLTVAKVFVAENGSRHRAEAATLKILPGPLLTPRGEFEMQKPSFQDIPFKKAFGLFHLTGETVELTGGKLWPPSGEIDFKGRYERGPDTYAFDFSGDRLRAEDFLKKAVFGPARFSGTFNGRILDATTDAKNPKKKRDAHFARGLSGKFNLALADGNIQKMGGLEKIVNLLNLSTPKEQRKNGLEYQHLGGDFDIKNGLLTTKNLALAGPLLKMQAVGKTDLPSGRVDANIQATPLKLLKDIATALPGLEKWLKADNSDGNLVTKFKVTGNLEDPKVKLVR